MANEKDEQAVGDRAWEALLVQAQANLLQARANEATSRGGVAPPGFRLDWQAVYHQRRA